MNKTFAELTVGARFTLNGAEYVKIEDVRVSCCKTVNCHDINNPSNRIYIQPSTTVVVNA